MDRTPDFRGFTPNSLSNFTFTGAQSLSLQAHSRQTRFNDRLREVNENAPFFHLDSADIPVVTFSDPVHFQNLKDLVKDTKDNYVSSNPNDDRWPCPFCFYLSQTKVQCRCHISRNHPQAERSLNQELIISDHPSLATSTNDSSQSNFNAQVTSQIEKLICFRCVGSSKSFKGLRGMKQHYSHSHKEFMSDFDNPQQFKSTNSQEPAQSSLSHDPNALICHRCRNNNKFYKGIHGLKIHYGIAHKEFFSGPLTHSRFCISN